MPPRHGPIAEGGPVDGMRDGAACTGACRGRTRRDALLPAVMDRGGVGAPRRPAGDVFPGSLPFPHTCGRGAPMAALGVPAAGPPSPSAAIPSALPPGSPAGWGCPAGGAEGRGARIPSPWNCIPAGCRRRFRRWRPPGSPGTGLGRWVPWRWGRISGLGHRMGSERAGCVCPRPYIRIAVHPRSRADLPPGTRMCREGP